MLQSNFDLEYVREPSVTTRQLNMSNNLVGRSRTSAHSSVHSYFYLDQSQNNTKRREAPEGVKKQAAK
jgi:hypothetical protein